MNAKVISVTALAALVFAAGAVAKTNDLAGPVRGDDDATVSMKVVIKRGRPKIAKNLTIKNLDYTCQASTAPGEKSVNLGTVRLRDRKPTFDFAVEEVRSGVVYIISGGMKETAVKARGTVFIQFPGLEVGELCSSTPGGSSFTAKLR